MSQLLWLTTGLAVVRRVMALPIIDHGHNSSRFWVLEPRGLTPLWECDPLVIKKGETKAQEKQVTLSPIGWILFKYVTCFHLLHSLWCRYNYPDFKDEEVRLGELTCSHLCGCGTKGERHKNMDYFIPVAPGDTWMLENRDQRDIWQRESLQNNWYELYETSQWKIKKTEELT